MSLEHASTGPTLLIGFDSAWTAKKSGGIVAVVRRADGSYLELGDPTAATFAAAEAKTHEWELLHQPSSTLVLLDQPTIVPNVSGQRPVENIVGSVVSRRYGGMQPANTGRADMFGPLAPLWAFLEGFGGAVDPFARLTPGRLVLETYPALAAIAFGWCLPDESGRRPSGRLPKYNPARKKTFSRCDWSHVTRLTAEKLQSFGLRDLAAWAGLLAGMDKPSKTDQDKLDACLCLLVALQVGSSEPSLVVGDLQTGYIVVPESNELRYELNARCVATGRRPEEWVRSVSDLL